MPNIDNIERPFTVISYGRSGTSLLCGILAGRDDIDFVGETADLIFLTWLGAERCLGNVRQNFEAAHPIKASNDEFCRAAVHGTFLRLFGSARPYWIHKPIGMPTAFWVLPGSLEEKASWYWRVLKTSFPMARYVTVLRNPFDVIVSAHLYWGFGINDLVDQLGEMATVIMHETSGVERAILYADMTDHPVQVTHDLCEFFGLKHDEAMIVAATERHVKSAAGFGIERDEIVDKIVAAPGFSHSFATVAKMWEAFCYSPFWLSA